MTINPLIYTDKAVIGIPIIDPGENTSLGDDDYHYRYLLNDSTGGQKLCTTEFTPNWACISGSVPHQVWYYYGTDGCTIDETYDRGINDSLFTRVSPVDPDYVGEVHFHCDSEGTVWIFGEDFNTSDTSELRVRTIQTDGTVTNATINIDSNLPSGNPPGHSSKSYNSSANNRPYAFTELEIGGAVLWQTNYGTGVSAVSPDVLMVLEKTLTTINSYFVTDGGSIVEDTSDAWRGQGGGGLVATGGIGIGNISNTGVVTNKASTTTLKINTQVILGSGYVDENGVWYLKNTDGDLIALSATFTDVTPGWFSSHSDLQTWRVNTDATRFLFWQASPGDEYEVYDGSGTLILEADGSGSTYNAAHSVSSSMYGQMQMTSDGGFAFSGAPPDGEFDNVTWKFPPDSLLTVMKLGTWGLSDPKFTKGMIGDFDYDTNWT